MGMHAAEHSKCEPDGFGGWKFNDMSEMSDKAKLNLYDVVKMTTAPKTKGSGQSYSVFVNDADPKESDVFISHAWAEKFAYLVFVLCYDLFPVECFQREDLDTMSEDELKQAKAMWQKMLGIGDKPL